MPGFREFLARFRPAGSPGPAVAGAVPADRSRELTAELEAPLALLDEAVSQATAMRETASREAVARRRAAALQAESVVRAARERAQEVRRETAARVGEEARTEGLRADAEAELAVREMRQRALGRTRALAARLTAQVVDELTGPTGTAPDGPRRETPWVPGGSRE